MQIIHDDNCIRLNIMFLSSKTFLMFHAGAMMKLFLIASLKVGSNDMICCSMENWCIDWDFAGWPSNSLGWGISGICVSMKNVYEFEWNEVYDRVLMNCGCEFLGSIFAIVFQGCKALTFCFWPSGFYFIQFIVVLDYNVLTIKKFVYKIRRPVS